jgi:hypothetical protein
MTAQDATAQDDNSFRMTTVPDGKKLRMTTVSG